MSDFNSQDRVVVYIDESGNTLQETLISSGILKINNIDVLSVTPQGDVQFSAPVLLELATPTSGSSAVNKEYVDVRDSLVSGTVTSGYQAANTVLSGAVVSGYNAADVSLSGVLKAYVDTRDNLVSGTVTSGYQAALTTYSGFAENRFVNVSGDTMTGSLTMSGTNILASTSGTSSIGTSGSPFNNVYSTNAYDDGNAPTSDNQLVNKKYLSDQLLVGTKQVFSYVFTAATNYFTTVNSSTLSVVGTMIFRGSDVIGIPSSIKAILGHSSTGVQFQLYDYTNSQVIVDVTTTNVGPILVDCGTISNVPTTEAIWQFRLRRTGSNGQGRIYSLDVRV